MIKRSKRARALLILRPARAPSGRRSFFPGASLAGAPRDSPRSGRTRRSDRVVARRDILLARDRIDHEGAARTFLGVLAGFLGIPGGALMRFLMRKTGRLE